MHPRHLWLEVSRWFNDQNLGWLPDIQRNLSQQTQHIATPQPPLPSLINDECLSLSIGAASASQPLLMSRNQASKNFRLNGAASQKDLDGSGVS